MTLAAFRDLHFEDQIVAVWEHGSYVATRYEEEDTVGLYHMRQGFFVELYYNHDENHLVQRTRPFPANDLDSLEDFAVYVRLDDLPSW